jgi:hypothetical protein
MMMYGVQPMMATANKRAKRPSVDSALGNVGK